jgi:putative DNA primase/helicase
MTSKENRPGTTEADSQTGEVNSEYSALADYIDAIIPDGETGILHYAYHLPGERRNGAHAEQSAAWPAIRTVIVNRLIEESKDHDVYVCPYVGSSKKRTKGKSVTRVLVHADVDNDDLDVGKVRELGGFAIATGTPGHAHVYVPLAQSVSLVAHDALCRGLQKYFGAKDAKCSDNDLLRPPGTLNHKPTLDGGDPAPVTWLVPHDGSRVDPETLALQLGVNIDGFAIAVGKLGAGEGKVNLDDYPDVAKAIAKVSNPPDRSADTARVVGACVDSDMTLAQTRWCVEQREDLSDRLNNRKDDDVQRLWIKLIDDRNRHRRSGTRDSVSRNDLRRSQTTDSGDDISAFKFPDGQRPTDVGNANRLLVHANGLIRYVHAWGKWIVYQHGRWIVDEKDALVTEKAKQVARNLYKLAAKTTQANPDEAKQIWAWALKSDTAGHIAAMIRLARGVDGLLVNHEDLDADPWILNCANGTVDLRTGELCPHDPADLCTLQVPVDYDPEATAPLWDACLKRWQPDDQVRDYLQLRAGAGATGIPTETVDIDYGEGGNGKSKFHGAVQQVLGPYATVPHKSLLVSGRFEQHPTVIADLFRKRLAVASETKAAEVLNDEQVKNLTGGDRLSGRRMREDPWGFWPTHTLVMFSNHKPNVQGRDEGIWRRIRLVPWTVTIPADERDEGLAVKLQAEAPGILRWIVEGARRFHDAGKLQPPEVVLAATAAYRDDEDVVGRFVNEVLEFGPHVYCFSSDIKAELEAWCNENDFNVPRMNEIATALIEHGATNGGRHKIQGKRSTKWTGVCVTQKGNETA